ncbi:hypothetical protein ES703_83430 [subsurface metagenome]
MSGLGDGNRIGIDYTPRMPPNTGSIIRLTAIECIVYFGIFGFGGDCNRKRRGIKTVPVAEFWVSNQAQISAGIFRSRSRLCNEPPNIISIRVAAVGNISSLVEKDNDVNKSTAIAIEQADFLATGTEFEIGMQACLGGIVVGPYQQIPTCGDDS